MQTMGLNFPLMGRQLRAASVAALGVTSLSLAAFAQSDAAQSEVARPGASALPVIPQQMRFAGTAVNRTGDTVEAVFSIYSAAEGGEPLFTETQQVAVDSEGHYAVLLGAATQGGLPQSLFAAGQARWLGVSIERSEEQPRTLLASVAYAMKAGDAETVGGLPATSFVTQQQFAASLGGQPQQAPTAPKSQFTPLLNPTVTGTGTTNYLPVWTSASNVGNSLIYQSGNNIGIGTTAPGGPLQLSTAYPAVTANSSNPISEFQVLTTGLPISSGVTDTGYRIGQKIVNYTTDPNFLGTLAAQYGLLASVGASTGAGSGTITNAYGVYINNLTGGSATITNNYGLYQATSTARNYFAGSVGIGTTTPTGDLEVSTAFPAVTTNGDNEIPEFLVSTEHLPISSGVTDTGYRVGAWIDNYTTDPQFLGTLSNQYGVLSRVGATTGSGSGTITNSYGVYIYNQTGGSATVTNPYGLYQASSAARNYFAGNVGIGTTSPAAKLEVNGTAQFDGSITFASGQTFPGTGTITGVAAGTGLVGGGSAGTVTLALDTTETPQLGTPNTFNGTQTIQNGNLAVSGGIIALPATSLGIGAGAIFINSEQFIHACCPNSSNNTFVGNLSGSPLADASGSNGGVGDNTAVGSLSLSGLFSGFSNTALGANALTTNTSGYQNTAVGAASLKANQSGISNTALGAGALEYNAASGYDTAIGLDAGNAPGGADSGNSLDTFIGALSGPIDGNLYLNATAIGYSALVGENSALALGGQGAHAVSVGIGTATPFNDYALDVEDTVAIGINSGVVVNAGGGNIYLGMTSGVHKFRVDDAGSVHIAGTYQTSGADFAESVAVRGNKSQYEAGDLLVIDRGAGRRLTLAHTPYSTLVAGIYSTRPGMLAAPRGIDEEHLNEHEVPLAVVGIVPCKVTAQNGPIREGDLLVTSSRPGYAMRGTDRRLMLGAVVGKALDALPKGEGVIPVLVTLQ